MAPRFGVLRSAVCVSVKREPVAAAEGVGQTNTFNFVRADVVLSGAQQGRLMLKLA